MRLFLTLAIVCFLCTYLVVGTIVPVSDVPFEQVRAERYLTPANQEECTEWPKIEIENPSFVQATPFYHSFASKGAWVYGSTTASGSSLQWFDVANGTLTPVNLELGSECKALIVPTSDKFSSDYTFLSLCWSNGWMIQTVLCADSDPTDCKFIGEIGWSGNGQPTSGVIVDSIGKIGTLFFGTEDGVHLMDIEYQAFTFNLNNITEPVSSLAFTHVHQAVFVGTSEKLWTYDIVRNLWNFEMVGSMIDAPITSLTYQDGTADQLWIGQSTGITLLSPVTTPDSQTHWLFTRVAGQISDPGGDVAGLPHANITALAAPTSLAGVSDGRVWLGSGRGLMRYDPNPANPADQWRVFTSARYMPQRDAWVNVSSLTVLSGPGTGAGNTAIALTAKGLAVIRFEMWTLRQKADYLQTTYMTTPGQHSQYGLVADCSTPVWGASKQCRKGPTDNDGLWTSIYLSSQVFKYQVTKDPADQASAWSHFEAMQFQQFATGIYGFPARSVALKSDFGPRENWYPSPTYEEWQYKGDTSSDEITGHEFIYPLVADLLAQTPEEVEAATLTAINITNQIVDNDLYLFGQDGNRTTWGVWNPAEINNSPSWQEGRGPNSVQILAWLVQGLAVNGGNTTFVEKLNYLLSEPVRYDVNLLNAKMLAVCDSNFSDDELNYLAYFNFRHGLNAARTNAKRNKKSLPSTLLKTLDTLESYMTLGLDMAQRYKVREKSSFYNPIYCYTSGQVGSPMEREAAKKTKTKTLKDRKRLKFGHNNKKNSNPHQTTITPPTPSKPQFDCSTLSADSVWYLRRWPLEQFNWPQMNSDRLDVTFNTPAYGCRAGQQSNELLPPDERGIHKWNNGPFELDNDGGYSEEGVGPFLSGYWMMKYYGMID